MTADIIFLNRWKNHTGCWMKNPDSWIWTTPALQPQGPGMLWRADAGGANLLWLALDMEQPPTRPYNWRYHQLCVMLATYGSKAELAGLPLFDQAASLTLAQFRNLCLTSHFTAPPPVPGDLPKLLALLANQRLQHAHT